MKDTTAVLDHFYGSSLLISASACSGWISVENNVFWNYKKTKTLDFFLVTVKLLDRTYKSWLCSLLKCYNIVIVPSDHHLYPVPD